MPVDPQTLAADPCRMKLARCLLERGLNETTLAKAIGIQPNHLSASLGRNASFRAYRHRLRVEFHLDLPIWHSADEIAEIRALLELLKIDLLLALPFAIAKAARDSGLALAITPTKCRDGFSVLRAILQAQFPNSETLTKPHYAALN